MPSASSSSPVRLDVQGRRLTLAVYRGATLVFGSRSRIWLFPAYALALYGHRYLENGIAPAFARRALNVAAYSQIMVGGALVRHRYADARRLELR